MKLFNGDESSEIRAIKNNPPRRVEGTACIDAMRRYIDNTTGGLFGIKSQYEMNHQELSALMDMVDSDKFGAISLAFKYGQAKGYRAAKINKKPKLSRRPH